MVWGHQRLQEFKAIPSLPLSSSTIQGHITTPYSYVTVTSRLLINFPAPYLPYTVKPLVATILLPLSIKSHFHISH